MSDKSSLWEFPPQKTILETYVIGFQLQGKKRNQIIYVADFDMVMTKNNQRLIPLFRLLRLLSATGRVEEDIITFRVESGPEAKLDVIGRTLHVDTRTIPVEIKIGNSDITGRGEIYVSEEVIKEAFGFDYKWNEQNYEYIVTTDKSLELFKQGRPQGTSLLSTKVQEPSSFLTETEPPAYPGKSKHLLSFIQTQIRADSQYHLVRDSHLIETSVRPSFTLWGNISSGNYRLKLSQNINNPNTKIPSLANWVDEGVWTSKDENMITKIGDTNLGCSELVAPGTSVFGASVKWISPQKEKSAKYDRYLKRRTAGYLSEDNFEGLAQLGATVELWVNNILIQTKLVEEPVTGKSGFGVYRFNSVGLLEKTLNEIKIVVKRTDGMIEEYYQQIIGTNALLAAGQWAVLSGGGIRRQKNLTDTKTEGDFFAAQINYGLTRRVTLGFTAAAQNKFAIINDTNGNASKSPKSYHAGQQINIRLLDRLLLKEEAALSIDPGNDTNAGAYKLGLESCWKRIKLESQMFSYSPRYMNALTNIGDRRGYFALTKWGLLKNWSMDVMGLHIYNNLSHNLPSTQTENIASINLRMPGIVPKTSISLGTYYTDFDSGIEIDNNFITRTYVADTEIHFTNDLDLEVRHVFGDRSKLQESENLAFGLSIPGIDQYFSRGTRVRAGYRVNQRNSLSSMYWKTDSERQAEVSYEHKYYNSEGKNTWDSRIDIGRHFTTEKFYSHADMEFKLDESGYSRFGLKADTKDNGREYYYGLYFSLNSLFITSDNGFKKVNQFGITPEQGGVQGFVYLDLNGNGSRDAGESGLPDIAVMVNGRGYGKSDINGNFIISRSVKKEFITVSLDEYSLPAIYIPTQGKQKVYWQEGIFTKANLGVCASNAVSGTVRMDTKDGNKKEASGIRVLLLADDDKTVIRDSVTASDGSFYIGEIKTGKYKLDIDPSYIPASHQPVELPRQLNILPGAEPEEIKDCDVDLIIKQ